MRNTFFKLMSAFISIMLISYIWGNIMYKVGVSSTINQVNKNSEIKAKAFLDDFEKKIDKLKELQYEFINNKSVNNYLYQNNILTDFRRVEIIWQIEEFLVITKMNNPLIKDIYFYIPSQEKIFDAAGIQLSVDALKKEYLSEDIVKDGYIESNGKQLFMSLSWPIRSGKPSFITVFVLSKDEITRQLENTRGSNELSILMNQAMDLTLFSFHDEILQKEIADYLDKLSAQNYDSLVTGKTIRNKQYSVVSVKSKHTDMIFTWILHNMETMSQVADLKVYYWIFMTITVSVIIIYLLISKKLVRDPLKELEKGLREIELGNYNYRLSSSVSGDMNFINEGFNRMVKEIKRLIDEEYKQKIMVQDARLKHLQTQVNPHFLYNCFFTLYNMIEIDDKESTLLMLNYLGKYFKYISNDENTEISLKSEVEHAITYLEIQTVRFGEKIQVHVDRLPKDWGNIMVPRMILQPVFENIFKHGYEKNSSILYIDVFFRSINNKLHIAIQDSGVGLSDAKIIELTEILNSNYNLGRMSGIVNIHNRLKLKFGGESGVIPEKSQKGGARFLIILDVGGKTDV